MCKWTRPPRGVNLMALESRFQRTCCRRPASPVIGPVFGSMNVWISTPRASAAERTTSSAASATAAASRARTSSCNLPLAMRAVSSRSSISRRC